MKQKLGLCCALIHEPDLLILDEPTTGVDPLSRRRFWELVETCARAPATDAAGGHRLHGRSRAVRTLPDARPRQADRHGLSHELAAVTPSGKLDEAFTHFQGDSGHDNQPLVIPPRQTPTPISPSRPTT
jgi:ribosome-dependent ATPase